MDTVRFWWWKVLGVGLILYSFMAGLLIPLGQGVVRLSPQVARAGDRVQIEILGYNSHYISGETEAWLRLTERHGLKASEVQVHDRRRLTAVFDMPSALPGNDTINTTSLTIHTPVDGYAVVPSAVVIRGNDASGTDVARWEGTLPVMNRPAGVRFPYRNILLETIRNIYFHVQLWMSMMVIFLLSMIYSVRYLRSRCLGDDHRAQALASTGLLWGLLGIATGMIWAKNTWGSYWSFDVKQNMAAIAMLIYLAYFLLRQSMSDIDVARRLSAAYNVFAFIMLVPLLYIIPRMTASLHPGSGGNPALAADDLDNTMRMVFYPAVLGWILFGLWVANVTWRYLSVRELVSEAGG